MNHQTMKLWQDGLFQNETGDFEPLLKTYLLSGERKRPAVLVLPGGGYAGHASHEAEPVAIAFNAMGYHAFVLYYSVAPIRHPQPLRDVSRAICMMRDNADQWQIDANKIAVCGFSAGGHLAGCSGVFWDDPQLKSIPGISPGKNKPNAVIMAYPVITPASHIGSFQNLHGKQVDADQMPSDLSLDLHVGTHVPPTFVWHTFEDSCVSVDGVLSFCTALRKHNVPFELHIYPWGGHGLSLASKPLQMDGKVSSHISTWFGLCAQWLELVFEQ